MKKISVVIVNWNGKDDTVSCLSSLGKLHKNNYILDIVVVDNGSGDGSVADFRKKFREVTVLENKENLGFCEGNNIGIRYALDHTADFVWLLNNDTTVDGNALEGLVAIFHDSRVGITGSKIYFSPGREFHTTRYLAADRGRVIWYGGGLIDWNNMYASHRGVDEVDTGQFDDVCETSFVTGCSMMVKREVFQKIGFFDDKFYLYLEDLDFCLRAKRAGFTLMYSPKSVVWHKNAASTDNAGNELHDYYLTRNRLLIGMRYASIRTKIALFREGISLMIHGSPIRRKAIRDALLFRFGNRYQWKK